MTGLIQLLNGGLFGQQLPSSWTERTSASKGKRVQFGNCLLFCLALILASVNATACDSGSTYSMDGSFDTA